MIKLNEIHKVYTQGKSGFHALKGISLYFEKGEVIAIYGPSGCGKTTLLNIIGGLDKPTSGDMVIGDRLTTQFFDREWDYFRNHRIGFIFQSYNLIEHLPVIENVALSIKLSGTKHSKSHEKAYELLKLVGLEEHVYKLPNELSGGERQRVAIARALISDPDIILADEPTGALDIKTGTEIMDLIKSISKNKLVILVTHNKKIAEKYSTRLIELVDGKVTFDSEVKDKKVKITLKRDRNKKKLSFKEAIRLALFNIKGKKWRTFLVSFGLSIGIIGLILIDALFNTIRGGLASREALFMNNPDLYVYTEHDDTVDPETFINNFNSAYDVFKDVLYSPNIDFKISENITDGTVFSSPILFSGIASPTNEELLDTFTNIIDGGRLPQNENEFAIPISIATSLLNENVYLTDLELWDEMKFEEFAIYSHYYYTPTIESIESESFNDRCFSTALWDGNVENLPEGYDETVLGSISDNIAGLSKYRDTPIVLNNQINIFCEDYSSLVWTVDYNNPDKDSDLLTLVGIFDNDLFEGLLFHEDYINFIEYQDQTIFVDSDEISYHNNFSQKYLAFLESSEIDNKVVIIRGLESHGYYVVENFGTNFDMFLGVTSLFMYILQFIFSSIVSIAIVTGGLMLLLILSISIIERNREIGLIRAMGGTKNDVKIIFTGETTIIGFFAGIISIILSIILVYILNVYLYNNYKELIMEYLPYVDASKLLTINFSKLIIAIFGSILIALISGLIPSMKAARKQPIEALRND